MAKLWPESGNAPIDVVEHAEDRAGADRTSSPARRRLGRLQIQTVVWAIGVVVRHELPEDRSQVLVVDDDQVVQALAPEGADDPFRNRVRSWRADRCQERLDAEALCSSAELPAVAGVAVAKQILELPSQDVTSVTCRQSHAAAGQVVTCQCTNSRRPWAMHSST